MSINNEKPCLPVYITKPIPLKINLEPFQIASEQYLDVDTGITQLGASNLMNPHPVVFDSNELKFQVNITNDPVANNLFNPHPVKITQTLPVNANITQLRGINLKNPHPVTVTQMDTNVAITKLGASNLMNPMPVKITETISVNIGTTEIGVSNLKNPMSITIPDEFKVDIGMTELWISNLLKIHPVSIPNEFPINIGTTALWCSNLENPLSISIPDDTPFNIGTTSLSISNLQMIHPVSIPQGLNVNIGTTALWCSNLENPHAIEIANTNVVVNTGLTEIAVSQWNQSTNANINIAAQSFDIETKTNNEDLANNETGESTLVEIKRVLPYIERLYSKANCIHASQYNASFLATDREKYLFPEEEMLSGSVSVNVDNSGFFIEYTQLNDIYKRWSFIPWNGGKTMYTVGFTISNRDTFSDTGIIFDIGFESLLGNGITVLTANVPAFVRFRAVTGDATGFAAELEIEIFSYDVNDNSFTRNITQSQFNIDPLDGSGPSKFIYNPQWASQQFFIVTDGNFHFIIGLIANNTMIPCHSIFDTSDAVNSGIRRPLMRPYWRTRMVGSVGSQNPKVYTNGFRIYKDSPIPLPTMQYSFADTLTRDVESSGDPETHIVSIRLKNNDKGSRNLDLLRFHIYPDEAAFLKIRVSKTESNNTILDPAPTWSDLPDSEVEIEQKSTDVENTSEGVIIYQKIIDTAELADIDLVPFKTWKYMSRGDQTVPGSQTYITFSIEKLTGSSNNLEIDYSLSWRLF